MIKLIHNNIWYVNFFNYIDKKMQSRQLTTKTQQLEHQKTVEKLKQQ